MSSASSIILKNNENVTFVSNPSITYFKSVYRKHTKFAIEYKEEAGGKFDTSSHSQIGINFNYSADLLCDISLKVEFKSPTSVPLVTLPPDLPLYLVDEIKFNFLGKFNDFDNLNKEYITLSAMLNNPKMGTATYTLNDGELTCNNGNNYQNMALCGGITPPDGPQSIKSMKALIPLPFAFSKSIGTAIPLCAFNQSILMPQIVIVKNPKVSLGVSDPLFIFSAIYKLWGRPFCFDTLFETLSKNNLIFRKETCIQEGKTCI